MIYWFHRRDKWNLENKCFVQDHSQHSWCWNLGSLGPFLSSLYLSRFFLFSSFLHSFKVSFVFTMVLLFTAILWSKDHVLFLILWLRSWRLEALVCTKADSFNKICSVTGLDLWYSEVECSTLSYPPLEVEKQRWISACALFLRISWVFHAKSMLISCAGFGPHALNLVYSWQSYKIRIRFQIRYSSIGEGCTDYLHKISPSSWVPFIWLLCCTTYSWSFSLSLCFFLFSEW